MSGHGLAQRLPRLWGRKRVAPILWLAMPLSWLFGGVVAIRRALFRWRVIPSFRLPVPVIVVGNLTVGGSGKTPLVLWLVAKLREMGWRPGIISRGYGGSAGDEILCVTEDSSARLVGDEPLLLSRRSRVPVFIGRDRVAAGQALLAKHPDCSIVISDDGLQHYRLERSVEIAVFDGRGAGNGCLLPAGPLREPLSRLKRVTALVWNGEGEGLGGDYVGMPQFSMRLEAERFVSLGDESRTCSAEQLREKALHAIAGIGDPSRFFAQLSAMGLQFSSHPFPDHHAYVEQDFSFARDGVLLMTEKDAVKCQGLALPEAWVLPVEAQIDESPLGGSLLETILERLNGRTLA